jgi:hypothetical protein
VIRDALAFSVPPVESIRVQFTETNASQADYRISEVLFSSPPQELDVSVCRLDPPISSVRPMKVAQALPLANRQTRVTLIGHPGGRSLEFSDGVMLDHDDRRLHYTTASEAGSSGSPVFNNRWQVIGIHHAGSQHMPRLHGQPGTYPASEAISILAIIGALSSGEPASASRM